MMVAYGWCFIVFFIKMVVGDVTLSSITSNLTIDKRNFDAFPEIRDGEPCVPGRMYRMECNTCKCSQNFALLCTKMACIDWKKQMNKGKKGLRQGVKKNQKARYLPKIKTGVKCKPGKLYRSGCRRCFCTDKRKIVCALKKEACKFDKHGNPIFPILTPEDVRPPIPSTSAQKLQVLPSTSEKCEPGKSYKVDCNTCICMENFNLLCTIILCISYDDMHRMEAKEMSGKPCHDGDSIIIMNCKECVCVNGKTDCHEIPQCREQLQLAGKEPPKAELDASRDKCQPNTIYRMNCNKCYCQKNGVLRCTQMACLNYSQVTLLEKQRQYLEEHGL